MLKIVGKEIWANQDYKIKPKCNMSTTSHRCIGNMHEQRRVVLVTLALPFASRKAAKFERRCSAILETARICAVNSSIIHPAVFPPIPSFEERMEVDFTTPESRIVSLT